MSKPNITVEALVNSGIKDVWEKWTKPEHIVNWNYASDDWHCPEAENDLKAGGKFRYRMPAKDGSVSFDFEGVYDEIEEHKKISYTLGDGRKVIAEFENTGNDIRVKETFDPESFHPEEMQRAGWQSILDNFKKYSESESLNNH